MKVRKLKGFSLVECIVAMALIGIASLLIAQVYGAVALMNKNNAALNTSLTEQIKLAETKTKDAVGASNVTTTKYTSKAGAVPAGYSGKVEAMKFTASGGAKKNDFKTVMPDADIDVIVLRANNQATEDGKTYTMDQDTRYKFILPAS